MYGKSTDRPTADINLHISHVAITCNTACSACALPVYERSRGMACHSHRRHRSPLHLPCVSVCVAQWQWQTNATTKYYYKINCRFSRVSVLGKKRRKKMIAHSAHARTRMKSISFPYKYFVTPFLAGTRRSRNEEKIKPGEEEEEEVENKLIFSQATCARSIPFAGCWVRCAGTEICVTQPVWPMRATSIAN